MYFGTTTDRLDTSGGAAYCNGKWSAAPTIGARHVSGFTDPPASCGPLAVNANFCSNGFGFNESRRTGWTIDFTHGTDVTSVAAPTLEGAEPIPFPVSVTISAGATPVTPTISWVTPGGLVPDAFRVNIFDVDGPSLPNGVKNVIHSAPISPSSTNYSLPAVLLSGRSLEVGHNYAINFQIIDLRPGVTEQEFLNSNNNALILSRSNSYFNFQPLRGDAPPDVALPQVGPDANPDDNRGAPYQFHVTEVGPTSVTFIDPPVAIGCEYASGSGDPNFASVLLPDVGDAVFEVVVDGVPSTVRAGQQFFFPEGGVPAFAVLGIETSAGLDSADVTAFITGLTFVTVGRVTGTMTPITQDSGVGTLAGAVGRMTLDPVGARDQLSFEGRFSAARDAIDPAADGAVVAFSAAVGPIALVELPASGWSRNGSQWRFQARKDGSTDPVRNGSATLEYSEKLGSFRLRLTVKSPVIADAGGVVTTSLRSGSFEVQNVQGWRLDAKGAHLVTP